MMRKSLFALFLSLVVLSTSAQDRLYTNTFNLNQVELLDGPFKHAMDLNVKVLLQYDMDRLLAPFLKEAGLPKKAELFPNWEGLDGHVGGHYVSALAIHYAATGTKSVMTVCSMCLTNSNVVRMLTVTATWVVYPTASNYGVI
jgi:hypothetical protein